MTPEEIELHKIGMRYKLIYSVCGLVLGFACILVGLVLGLNGVTGHTNFTASLLGLNTQLNDAAPGVVVFVVGIFMVWISKFSVKQVQQTNFPAHLPKSQEEVIQKVKSEDGGGAPEPAREPAERSALPTTHSSPAPSSVTNTITYTTKDSIGGGWRTG